MTIPWRHMLALERIATALEGLLGERARPGNTKRIRVEFVEERGDVLVFHLAPLAYVIATSAHPSKGYNGEEVPGLFLDPADPDRLVNTADVKPRKAPIEVPAVAIRESPMNIEGCPLLFQPGEYLQPDVATWGWREWVRL